MQYALPRKSYNYRTHRSFLTTINGDNIIDDGSSDDEFMAPQDEFSTTENAPVRKKLKSDKRHFVFVEIPIGDGKWEQTKIDVNDGDDIDDIRKTIKNENSNLFAATNTVQMKLFTSADEEKPLDAFKEWNPNVTWGTKGQPLFVKVDRDDTLSRTKSEGA